MLIDLLLILLVLLVLGVLAVGALLLASTLPLSDLGNWLLRRVGLAGASPGTRAAGMRAVGRVERRFEIRPGESHGFGKVFVGGEIWDAEGEASVVAGLAPGDAVEVVYGDRLRVTVLARSAGPQTR